MWEPDMSKPRSIVRAWATWCCPAALAFLLMTAIPARPGLAQTAQKPDAIGPVEDFSRQLDELKKSFVELNKRIEESARTIDRETDPQASRKEIAELRELVGSLLGAVADNGARQCARALRKSAAHAADQRRLCRRVDGDPPGRGGAQSGARSRQADPR